MRVLFLGKKPSSTEALTYLIEKGVRSTRIDVRALGYKGEGEPKNRVDVNLIER